MSNIGTNYADTYRQFQSSYKVLFLVGSGMSKYFLHSYTGSEIFLAETGDRRCFLPIEDTLDPIGSCKMFFPISEPVSLDSLVTSLDPSVPIPCFWRMASISSCFILASVLGLGFKLESGWFAMPYISDQINQDYKEVLGLHININICLLYTSDAADE